MVKFEFGAKAQFADISVLQVVESEPRMGADFCFNVYDGKRALMVAASSQTEKLQWMEDIVETVQVLLLLFLFYYYYFSFIMGTVCVFRTIIYQIIIFMRQMLLNLSWSLSKQ